ncbi:hypothetical protein [Streptacidiphilus monticola]|uniref:Lipoprotein n=1 Tax=Streptacidiphilus monticola TaxID=2161674 RepID=A0ABW1FVX4_9ACTN
MSSRRLPSALLLAAAALALAGCGPKHHAGAEEANPAALEPVKGSAVQKVVLTPVAARLLDVRTVPVGRTGGSPSVPLTALVYDPDGASWVYVPAGARSYLRRSVTVTGFSGDTVLLGSGPAVGTPVVTSSADELLGTEYGVGEE